MAKSMKNPKRDKESLTNKRAILVEAAIDLGLTSRTEIAKSTALKLQELNNLFRERPELYAKFCIVRKTIVDMAADNMMDIVADRAHPKNYDASKFVITNYKSDLDASLESKVDGIDVEIGGSGKSGASPITIRFGKKKEEE
tara:strand:- start:417 stop:842 length:426 start_codon:yes stop_codon:yes gene_type:complete